MNGSETLIGSLEQELKALILEWERFFSGDRKTPPHKEKTRLERRIRQLADRQSFRGAMGFRLEQLQHRFSTYSALWERQLRQREEGRGPGVARGKRPVLAATTPARSGTTNAPASTSVKRTEPGGLYERWLEAKRGLGQRPGLSREQFEAQLEAQRAALEKRLGRPVEFDVAVRDGSVRLAARARKKTDR